MITLIEIQNAYGAYHHARHTLSTIGRDIYNIRNPEHKLSLDFVFTDYEAFTMSDNSDWEYEEELGFPVGTPLIRVGYYNDRWEDTKMVFFPASYLDGTDGYKEREVTDSAKREGIKTERERLLKAARDEKTQKARRDLFETLKAEFGNS